MIFLIFDLIFINILIAFSEGPREDAFNFDLVPDYNTQTSVDLGQLGGKTFAKAKYEGNKLITHIHNIKTGRHFLTAIR